MEKLDRDKCIREFASYTANYNAEDPKIKLKIDHTYRVAAIAEEIAESIPKSAADIDKDMAWLSGMLHDIGRFEQVRRFGTFLDSKSVDHANFGADLLFGENLIERFGQFSSEEKEILEISIRNHSAYSIQEGLSDKIRPYCAILRDADKIDIFRVNYDTPMEEIYDVSTEALKMSPVTEEVKQCFRERHAVLRSLRKEPLDMLVSFFCLVYELEYPKSLEIAKRQGYVDLLLGFESDNPDTREWFSFMKENIWK